MSQYFEVIRPPFRVIAFIYFLFASLSLAIWAALDNPAGIGSLIIFTFLMWPIINSLTMKIEVTDELRINRAHIDKKFLGLVREVNGSEFKKLMSQDARAYLATKFWLLNGVYVEIEDENDPTPYWLISSKNSEALMRNLYKQR